MSTKESGKLAPDQIERLRVILERKQKRRITSSEATTVGESLMEFYEALAGEVCNARRGK